MNENKRGILTIISGFSGAGKGTVVKALLEKYPERFKLSISATTRQPREGEAEGINYFFKTKDAFEKMIEDNELLEWAQYVKNYYGTPRKYVEEQLDAGYDVILEIEQQGAFLVKKALPEAVLVFLTPPTVEELERRLRGRGTETEEQIQGRLAQAAVEAESIDLYDYLVINDIVDGCVESLVHLIDTEREETFRNQEKINEFQRDLQIYKKGE